MEMGLGPFFFVTTQSKLIIANALAACGYELIEAEYTAARGLWRVFIDRHESKRGLDLIGLEDCVAVSDVIQDALIASNVEFDHLEVSTPGMDRALTKPNHFIRFAGDVVKLTIEPPFETLRKLTGTLIGFQDNVVAVDVDGVLLNIPYTNVARARVVPQF